MATEDEPRSILEDEARLRWSFLEEEPDACAVVSSRMELVYLNSKGQELALPDWFGRRCFEVFPADNDRCAWKCPTISAVHESDEIAFSEETLRVEGEASPQTLGVAVIPLHGASAYAAAQALLVLRPPSGTGDAEFKRRLLEDAQRLRERVASRLGA